MGNIFIALLIINVVLLIWNLISYKRYANQEKQYYELNAKLNYITATGTVFIILLGYLGYNNEQNLNTNNERKIKEFITEKSSKIDSLINSKDILKAGIYIVNDIEFKENREYKFEDLKTIDNKNLPKFSYSPKLIINTSTGENLRIKKVTNTYFILSTPISKHFSYWAEGDNANYPNVVKFDVWIANYKTN